MKCNAYWWGKYWNFAHEYGVGKTNSRKHIFMPFYLGIVK